MTTNAPPVSPSPVTPKIGDILVRSWGYDQTNITYYMVVGVTAKSVKIRKLWNMRVASSDSGTTDQVVPNTAMFNGDEVLTRRFAPGYRGVGYCVREGSLWDGKPQTQTAANCGH